MTMKTFIHLLFTFYFFFSFVSCRQEQVPLTQEELARQDSLSLHVAVMPVIDCLPIYYAERMGIFSNVGIQVRLHEYLSQMDCDTALLKGRSQLAYTDYARLLDQQTDTLPLNILFSINGQVKLVTAHSKRIRKLRNLKERTVALNRLSMADYWSDEIMHKAQLDQADIYRPQINDLRLRTSMLIEQLVDAALLPEPYATQAIIQGNPCIFSTPDSTYIYSCIALQEKILADTLRAKQIRLFVKAYNAAVEEINAKSYPDSIRKTLIQHYQIPSTLVDSLHIPILRKAFQPRQNDIEQVTLWLKERERKISTHSPILPVRFSITE